MNYEVAAPSPNDKRLLRLRDSGEEAEFQRTVAHSGHSMRVPDQAIKGEPQFSLPVLSSRYQQSKRGS